MGYRPDFNVSFKQIAALGRERENRNNGLFSDGSARFTLALDRGHDWHVRFGNSFLISPAAEAEKAKPVQICCHAFAMGSPAGIVDFIRFDSRG